MGFVDTIAGGGLITLSTLLLGGVPPLQVLRTKRFQGAVGVLVAPVRETARGLDADRRRTTLIYLWPEGSRCRAD